MTRRVMAGWVLLSQFCQGVECHSTPLITKDGKKECVVCGGCGDGTDGAYIAVEDYDVVPTDEQLQAMRENGVMPDEEDGAGYEITPTPPRPASPTTGHTFEEIQQDFETKRNMVSKEIGKRMIEGWTLLDSSCPNCVMPLMMDPAGNTDVCVLCGLVNTIQDTDGSTIKTVDVPTKTVPAGKATPTEAQATEIATLPSNSQTKSYTDDAETMYTTLPTVHDTATTVKSVSESSKDSEISEDLPPAPTFTKKEQHTRDDLTQSIRESVQRQQPNSTTTAPRSDPPASSKPATSAKKAIDPDTVTTSLSHKDLMGDDKYSTKEVVSVGTISAMIMGTATGHETMLNASMSKEEVKDIVDIYVATSLSGNLSEEVKDEVVENLQRKLEECAFTPGSLSDEVIHLEDVPSPQNFKFDMVPSEEADNNSKKHRPSPEMMGRSRSKGMPPRPDSARSPKRPPRSTTSRSSPHNGKFIIMGGPSDVTSLGEMSRAESVATDALDSILDRIDAAKATLLRDDVTVREQLEAANLIEKLAQAAVAVKALEKIDH